MRDNKDIYEFLNKYFVEHTKEAKKLIYISGPYSARSNEYDLIEENIIKARKWARTLLPRFDVITPHLNNYHFELYSELNYNFMLKLDLNILDRCDGIFLMPEFYKSGGSLLELAYILYFTDKMICTNDMRLDVFLDILIEHDFLIPDEIHDDRYNLPKGLIEGVKNIKNKVIYKPMLVERYVKLGMSSFI